MVIALSYHRKQLLWSVGFLLFSLPAFSSRESFALFLQFFFFSSPSSVLLLLFTSAYLRCNCICIQCIHFVSAPQSLRAAQGELWIAIRSAGSSHCVLVVSPLHKPSAHVCPSPFDWPASQHTCLPPLKITRKTFFCVSLVPVDHRHWKSGQLLCGYHCH